LRIRITGHGGEGKFQFGESGPWKEFEKVFLESGHEICNESYEEQADAIIANSYNSAVEKYLFSSEIPVNKRILVNWEPYIVERVRYRPEVFNRFGSRFAPSVEWAAKVNGTSFKWPQDEIVDPDIFLNWSDRSNSAVMIQGNKFSARKGELYSLRRKVLNMLHAKELTLFGTNWNSGLKFDWWHWSRSIINSNLREISFTSFFGMGRNYDQYKGKIDNKALVLSKYRICIVIENSADFVSEKLFDAVRAGCVVVYVGPNLEKFDLPKSSAIEVVPNPNAIVEKVRYLRSKSESELMEMAKIQFVSLKSVSGEWSNTKVLRKLAQDMLKLLEK
jgi:hypothetical protein